MGSGANVAGLIVGLIVGLLYGISWLIQWSMVIHNEMDYARLLKRRLSLATALMILIILWFIFWSTWLAGG